MTTTPEDVLPEEEKTEDIVKLPPTAARPSQFGPPGGGSKFGNNASGFQNPVSKGRPGRAAARGR